MIDLSLDRMGGLLGALGNPERRLGTVVHVAGTNAKGSVIAMLREILEADGRRVHTFTSPGLSSIHECIRLGGLPGQSALIGEAALAALLERVLAACETNPVTPFEGLAGAAFLAFAETPGDVVLLETGLGGRLDATNMVERPALTIITPVALDHTEWLGQSIAEIAAEKAGILKAGVACVVASQPDAALQIFRARADGLGVRLLESGRDWDAFEQHGRLVFQQENVFLDLPLPGLAGRHQIANAGVAIAASLALGDFAPGAAAVARGVANVRWPGRLERLDVDAGADTPSGASLQEFWLDGAHNGAASIVLAHAMAELEERAALPLHVIVGLLETKDVERFLEPFLGLAEVVIAVPVPESPMATARTMPPDVIAGAAETLGIENQVATSLDEAIALSRARAETRTRVLICGSLHLIGAARRLAGPQTDPRSLR